MKDEIIYHYFGDLSDIQKEHFQLLGSLYSDWNRKINVVSRKDVESLYERHVLHSLGIAKVLKFLPETHVLDVGTGGGFPGIPLAILHPEARFTLIDAIGKKIRVVDEVVTGLGLENVDTVHGRVEDWKGSCEFIVSRAVAAMDTFVHWTRGKISSRSRHELPNGILYLKGGDLEQELRGFPDARRFPLSSYFGGEFFATKEVVYLPNS